MLAGRRRTSRARRDLAGRLRLYRYLRQTCPHPQVPKTCCGTCQDWSLGGSRYLLTQFLIMTSAKQGWVAEEDSGAAHTREGTRVRMVRGSRSAQQLAGQDRQVREQQSANAPQMMDPGKKQAYSVGLAAPGPKDVGRRGPNSGASQQPRSSAPQHTILPISEGGEAAYSIRLLTRSRHQPQPPQRPT